MDTGSSPAQQPGFAHCHSVLGSAALADWRDRIDAQYSALAHYPGQAVAHTARPSLPPGERFVPTASSFTLGAVAQAPDLHALFSAIISGPAGAWVTRHLPGPLTVDLDQAWARRQYAPGRYPTWHAPHGWHQDGALGYDFLATESTVVPSGSLLQMATCWIALDHCGRDAPGLELVRHRFETLLPPAELADGKVRSAFGSEDFWQPILQPGDAILFRGDILHRTYVMPSMAKDRTSIELRFFPFEQIPARLANDRFMHVR